MLHIKIVDVTCSRKNNFSVFGVQI